MAPDAARRSLRVCLIGDSIAAGTGDERSLGWQGRLAREAARAGHDLTIYDLGIRGDTSREVAARWESEARARLPEVFPAAILFQFGINDCAVRTWADGRVERRVRIEETEEATRTILVAASSLCLTGMIGPAPVDDSRDGPQLLSGVRQRIGDTDVAHLDQQLQAVARAQGVSYLSVHEMLVRDGRWQRALRDGDGVHPAAAGYDALAELVSAWPLWQQIRAIARGGQG